VTDASLSLQRAIYAHLKADAALKAEIGDPARLFDDPPAGAAFPYVTLGEAKTRGVAGVDGALEHDVRLHVFSKYAGRAEVKRIMGAVYDALDEAALTLVGHSLVSIRFVFSDAFRRGDGETYQGVLRFRAVTQET
jgi:hypothetical protein